MRLANGNVVHPDHSIEFPNGQVRMPNGLAVLGGKPLVDRPPHDPRFTDPRSQVPGQALSNRIETQSAYYAGGKNTITSP